MTAWAGYAFLLLTLFCGQATGQAARPTKVRVGGVELHYVQRGSGEPLILLHGGQGDYGTCGPQVDELSRSFRVISYSRRYNYPNNNPLTPEYRSAYTDAEDLAAFIRHLKLGRVHLSGHFRGRAGGTGAGRRTPEDGTQPRSGGAPVHRWAKDDTKGEPLYREFMTNSRFFKAATASSVTFPELSQGEGQQTGRPRPDHHRGEHDQSPQVRQRGLGASAPEGRAGDHPARRTRLGAREPDGVQRGGLSAPLMPGVGLLLFDNDEHRSWTRIYTFLGQGRFLQGADVQPVNRKHFARASGSLGDGARRAERHPGVA